MDFDASPAPQQRKRTAHACQSTEPAAKKTRQDARAWDLSSPCEEEGRTTPQTTHKNTERRDSVSASAEPSSSSFDSPPSKSGKRVQNYVKAHVEQRRDSKLPDHAVEALLTFCAMNSHKEIGMMYGQFCR